MINWVFDLDNTIYNTDNVNYRHIKKDNYLKCLLNNLQGKKYVFTNAGKSHAVMVLKRLGIIDIFTYILGRFEMRDLKPNMTAYHKFIQLSGMNTNNTTVFFEDTLINLRESKKLGWKTVFIGKNAGRTSVDYIFKDIHTALEHFSFNPGQCHIHQINY